MRASHDAAPTVVVATPGSRSPARPSRRLSRKGVSTFLLIVMATLGPAIAYAGIQIVYPESTFTADVDTSPPITFNAGGDQALLETAGLSGSWANANNNAAFTLTLNGLSGGNVTVDDLVNVSAEAAVASYKFEIVTALAGINPDYFVIRFYTGTTAPSADGDDQVCAVLNLEANAGVETAGSCTSSVDAQVIYVLPDGQTTESGTVEIRPSSITFA